MAKKIYKIAAGFAVFLFFYFVSLYSVQNSLLFFPDKTYVSPQNAGTPDFEEHPIVMKDGQMVMSWYAKGDVDKPMLLYFHGNAGQIATFAPMIDLYRREGYPVLMLEYRGFASTGGKRTEETMLSDAIHTYDYVKQVLGFEKVVAYGYSMGTGVASGLSQYRMLDGLILAAPFSSLKGLVKEKPVPFATLILKTNFLSDNALASYSAPLLIIHGKQDKLIPPHHGEKLFDIAQSADKTLELLGGQDHYNLFFNAINHLNVLEWLGEKF